MPSLVQEFMRNAAVDGDAATYTYWDGDAPAPGGAQGRDTRPRSSRTPASASATRRTGACRASPTYS